MDASTINDIITEVGDLEVLKWLKFYDNKIVFSIDHLIYALEYNRLDIAKYIHSLNNTILPSQEVINLAMKFGNKDIVMWAKSLGILPEAKYVQMAKKFEFYHMFE
jgi:uncharacterized protein YifN (PemK superfamily)